MASISRAHRKADIYDERGYRMGVRYGQWPNEARDRKWDARSVARPLFPSFARRRKMSGRLPRRRVSLPSPSPVFSKDVKEHCTVGESSSAGVQARGKRNRRHVRHVTPARRLGTREPGCCYVVLVLGERAGWKTTGSETPRRHRVV